MTKRNVISLFQNCLDELGKIAEFDPETQQGGFSQECEQLGQR